MLKVDEKFIGRADAPPKRSWWPLAGTIVFILCAAVFPMAAKAIGDPCGDHRRTLAMSNGLTLDEVECV